MENKDHKPCRDDEKLLKNIAEHGWQSNND